MKNGNVIIVAMIFVAISIVIILLVAAIFMSHVNSILYRIKLDMYTMNRSAIIAVNKGNASIDRFTYHKETYRKNFEEELKRAYKLNDAMENEQQLIQKMRILQYEIYEKGKKDQFTKEKCDDRVIHTVIEVKMHRIILPKYFEKIFTFTIHEDINLNMVNI